MGWLQRESREHSAWDNLASLSGTEMPADKERKGVSLALPECHGELWAIFTVAMCMLKFYVHFLPLS